MKLRMRPLTLLFSIMLVFSLGIAGAYAQGNGKGKGGGGGDDGGGDPPPTTLYDVEYISTSMLLGSLGTNYMRCNDQGQIVGRYDYDSDGDGVADGRRGWLFDPVLNSALGIAPSTAIDLNMIVTGIPEGWEIYAAYSINEQGDIGGAIAQVGAASPTKLQAVYIDMNANPPFLHIVPDGDISDDTLIRDLNDHGDLLGSFRRPDGTDGVYVYNFDPNLAMEEPLVIESNGLELNASWDSLFINNSGEIAGWLNDQNVPFRVSGTTIDTFTDVGAPRGLNQFGEFCSGVRLLTGKGKNKYTNYPCIVADDVQPFLDAVAGSANDLNDAGDFIQDDYLYHRDLGLIDVMTVVDPSEQTFLLENNFNESLMTNRDSPTSLPIIIGNAAGMPVRLVPIVNP